MPQKTSEEFRRQEKQVVAPVEERIVLVHGIGAKRVLMWPLAERLRRRGFRVLNWGYPSFTGSIEQHAARLRTAIEGELAHGTTVHLVAHSMGSIVTRAALQSYRTSPDSSLPIDLPAGLGRCVLLTPPNRGSRVADFFAGTVGKIIHPIAQLTTQSDSFVNQLPETLPLPTGIIAAKYDALVAEELTHLPNERDHLLLPALHGGVLFRHDVVNFTTHFLRHERFRPDSPLALA